MHKRTYLIIATVFAFSAPVFAQSGTSSGSSASPSSGAAPKGVAPAGSLEAGTGKATGMTSDAAGANPDMQGREIAEREVAKRQDLARYRRFELGGRGRKGRRDDGRRARRNTVSGCAAGRRGQEQPLTARGTIKQRHPRVPFAFVVQARHSGAGRRRATGRVRCPTEQGGGIVDATGRGART